MLEVLSEQVQLIEADLQILRDENVVLESERDPNFRERVKVTLGVVRGKIKKAQSALEDAQ